MKKLLACLLCLALVACGTKKTEPIKLQSFPQEQKGDNYTVAVHSQYKLKFANETLDTYAQDALLQRKGNEAILSQNINANGQRSTIKGNYYNGRIHNTFNGVSYYEEMGMDALIKTMLVPIEPLRTIKAEQLESYRVKNGVYTYSYKPEPAKEVFLNHFDSYGLNKMDELKVKKNEIIDTFQGNTFISETVKFTLEIKKNNQKVEVEYQSKAERSQVGSTKISISEAQKEQEKKYVHFKNIDTSQIKAKTKTDDTPENDVLATLKKRLVGRLDYKKVSDNEFKSKFNSHEEYSFLFDITSFQYKNYSLEYVYNWKSNIASTGSCTYNFNNGAKSSTCSQNNLDIFKKVKDYFKLELYYCGLSSSDFIDEKK
ncbi:MULTISPECIES: hypothetical protein [Terrabacteria group]|uniref:hypothetical protein n=1 Tax=Bacillati TaxID=1783272 RepID=UPI001C6DDA64|nr:MULTISPECIES: hypothetical protein [Terrabacteria group]MBW9212761.1 hypothetical protein [Trueperella sp. zg.1013]